MSVENLALAYASAAGVLQGTIQGILNHYVDEISPSVKKQLEDALKRTKEELERSKRYAEEEQEFKNHLG